MRAFPEAAKAIAEIRAMISEEDAAVDPADTWMHPERHR